MNYSKEKVKKLVDLGATIAQTEKKEIIYKAVEGMKKELRKRFPNLSTIVSHSTAIKVTSGGIFASPEAEVYIRLHNEIEQDVGNW